MIAQPAGWLKTAAQLAREHGTPLIADEVMTGFGRTGVAPERDARQEKDRHGNRCSRASTSSLFASHKEGVQPDYLCLAKGLTGQHGAR